MSSIEPLLRHYEENPQDYQHTIQSILDSFRPYKTISQGRILDTGCAYGLFLLEWEKLGLECYGVEVSTETAKYAKEKGVNVHIGTLYTASFPSSFFDFITMSHVLEHDPAPLVLMKEIS